MFNQDANPSAVQRLPLDQFQRYRANSGPNVSGAQGFQHLEA